MRTKPYSSNQNTFDEKEAHDEFWPVNMNEIKKLVNDIRTQLTDVNE